MYKFIITHFIM